MPNYVCLISFTDTGVRNLRKTTVRSKAFQRKMEDIGIKFISTLWTVGQYDMVHIFDAPNDEIAGNMAFTLNAYGNLRTNTMRAFTADEMSDIINNIQTPYDLINEPSARPDKINRQEDEMT